MIAYIDSSVFVSRIFGERASAAAELQGVEALYTSELSRVECLRALDSRRGELSPEQTAELTVRLARLLGTVSLVTINKRIMKRAADPFPTRIRTLDAIHLATALLLADQRKEALVFLTYDKAQGATATACGLETRLASGA